MKPKLDALEENIVENLMQQMSDGIDPIQKELRALKTKLRDDIDLIEAKLQDLLRREVDSLTNQVLPAVKDV